MKVAVIGTGYVGLVSGTCLAQMGHTVSCVDNDRQKVTQLRRGEVPIYEPGLAHWIAAHTATGRLRFGTDTAAAVADADVVLIAVGTPARADDGHADLGAVFTAVQSVAKAMRCFTVIAIKSTVPVGTGDKVEQQVREARLDANFAVVSNPEFLQEGSAIADFMRPDRIIVGSNEPRGAEAMCRLYAPLVGAGHRLVQMNRRGAELTKYAANALLATKITFINEIADLCERTGINVSDVAHGIGLDARIGAQFLRAGPGYGGSCFPKDTQALIRTAQEYGARQHLVETVVQVNERRKRDMGQKVLQALAPTRGKTVAVLGLAFKANTNDVRDSPAISVIRMLQDQGVTVRVSDPQALKFTQAVVPGAQAVMDPYEAAAGADALVIMTDWPQFRELNLARIKAQMRGALLIDLRNLLDVRKLEAAGFRHMGIGRPARLQPRSTGRASTYRYFGKTVLITGGAGFLGSHLAARLVAEGSTVYCLDNLSTGRRQNLMALLSAGRVRLIEHDLLQPLPDLPRFDAIYNLACPASPVHYQADPVATLRVCSEGVLRILDLATRDRADVFHASTSEVYGDPDVHPQPESYRGSVTTVGPRSCYDEGKRYAEALMSDYCRQNRLRLRMVRIFNTYGPHMHEHDGRVISNFVIQALQGRPITIYGNGSQTRSFCYVDDLIEGFMALMAAGDEAAGPMNLGNPAEITIAALAKKIIALAGSDSQIEYRPLPTDDPRRRRPDLARATAVLGWAPRIDLQDGLVATLDYFRRVLGDAASASALVSTILPKTTDVRFARSSVPAETQALRTPGPDVVALG